MKPTPRLDPAFSYAQGRRHAERDIADLGLGFAAKVANKMRRGDDTPYADGYSAGVESNASTEFSHRGHRIRHSFAADRYLIWNAIGHSVGPGFATIALAKAYLDQTEK